MPGAGGAPEVGALELGFGAFKKNSFRSVSMPFHVGQVPHLTLLGKPVGRAWKECGRGMVNLRSKEWWKKRMGRDMNDILRGTAWRGEKGTQECQGLVEL